MEFCIGLHQSWVCHKLCFDESLNHILNRKQMNFTPLYFDGAEKRLIRSYVGSSFIGLSDTPSDLSNLG